MPDIINFNANTGARLAPGESFVNNQTGKTMTQGTALPVDSLNTSVKPITLPNAPSLTTASPVTVPTPNPDVTPAFVSNYLSGQTPPPNTADIYNQDYANAGIADKTQQVNDLSAQLNGINKNAEVAKQTLASQSAGKDVTTAFLGKQQQEIDRQAAIQGLPVAAQLQAAQGNLQAAQSHVDTLFKIHSTDAQNLYDYNQAKIKAVYDYATTAQKAQLDAKAKADDQAFQTKTANIKSAQEVASTLVKFDPQTASKIMGLDPNSPTYTQDLAKAVSGAKVDPMQAADLNNKLLSNQKLVAEINKLNAGSGTNDSTAYVAGTDPNVDSWVQNINSGKAKLSDITGNAALKSKVSQGLAQTASSTSDILTTTQESLKELNDMVTNNKGFSGAVGFKGLIGSFTGPIAGTQAANFANKAVQVVNDVVLPNLTLLHGLGRVTDREFQALSSAIQGLGINQDKNSRFYGTSSLSQEQFKTELKTITDRIQAKVDEASKQANVAGFSASVGGQTYSFPDQKSLDAFKKEAGIK